MNSMISLCFLPLSGVAMGQHYPILTNQKTMVFTWGTCFGPTAHRCVECFVVCWADLRVPQSRPLQPPTHRPRGCSPNAARSSPNRTTASKKTSRQTVRGAPIESIDVLMTMFTLKKHHDNSQGDICKGDGYANIHADENHKYHPNIAYIYIYMLY